MTTVETIQLTPTERIRVVVDETPTCPRGDWHMLTGFVKIAGHGDDRLDDVPAVHEPPIPILDAFSHFDDKAVWNPTAFEGRGGWRFPLLGLEAKAVERWALIFHGLVVEYDSEHGGFWFVAGADAATAETEVDSYARCLFYDNWPNLKVGTPEHIEKQREVIAQERETYRQWAEGEVHGVVYETSTTLAPVEWDADGEAWELRTPVEEDDLVTEWSEEDSIWGVFGDRDEWLDAAADMDISAAAREAIREERTDA